jgi:phosphocarrier protein HPr
VKISRKVKVKNAMGLHARPASVIVKILQEYKCAVYFTCRKEKVNARSIMSILTLAASKNSLVTIDVEGEDAEVTINRLVEAFEQHFWEKIP